MVEDEGVARPPFKAKAWLRFRDGFEATAVAEATTEAASSFPFKDQRKSYCACYKLYFLLCYKSYKKNL